MGMLAKNVHRLSCIVAAKQFHVLYKYNYALFAILCKVYYVGFVVDQTPTPTRFLKSCEEVGLFQEISPFDKDFKKAIDQQQNEVCTAEGLCLARS